MTQSSGKVRKVAIISRESDSKTLDIRLLEEELLRRGIKVTVLSKLLTKDKSLKAVGYIGHMLRQEAAILSSDAVVLDTYCIPASMLRHRKNTKVIQIWHSLAAIKKFGWQTVGKPGGSSERTARLMKMHRGYDYVAAGSDITAEHYCEAFRVSRDKIVKLGLPRIDYIKDITLGDKRDEMRERIFEKYPELASSDKKLVLYAPTFRKGKAVETKSLTDAIDKSKYNVVVKLHPLYRQAAAHAEGAVADEHFSSINWLAAADIVISDYSSLAVEAALADRPLYIYAYDLDEYEQSTGLNVDFSREPIASYAFKDAKELAAALDKEYDMDALRAFRDRYMDIDVQNRSCTEQLADFIEGLR